MFKRRLLIAGSGNAGVVMRQAADGSITGKHTGQPGSDDFAGQAEGNAFELGLSTDRGKLGQGNVTATKK